MSPLAIFQQAVETLKPGASGRDIAELLDGKVKRTTAGEWKAGRAHAPKWAMELLAAKIQGRIAELHAIAERARNAPERPGLKAGARNLAIYRQRISREPNG